MLLYIMLLVVVGISVSCLLLHQLQLNVFLWMLELQQDDIETKKMKEEMKLKEAQARDIAEHGELALIAVDGPQTIGPEKITLRPPMLQVYVCPCFIPKPSWHSMPMSCCIW